MNLSEIKDFRVFLFSKKKIIFFTCSSLFIFTLLFNLWLPQNYRGEITIHKFNDRAIEEYANQNNKFFGFLNDFNSKYNVTYNHDKNEGFLHYNQLDKRYLYDEDYFINFIRNNIDSALIKEGILHSKIYDDYSDGEINQKISEYINKIKLNSSKEFLTGFIRSEKNYFYLTFKHHDPNKIKIFLDYLITESILDLESEYFDKRKLEFIKLIESNIKKQKNTIIIPDDNFNSLNVLDPGFSNLYLNQKISKNIYNREIKECVVEIENLIKKVSLLNKNTNKYIILYIYDFTVESDNALSFLNNLLIQAKKVNDCNILVEPFSNNKMLDIIYSFENENKELFKKSYLLDNQNYLYNINLINYNKSNIQIIKIEKFIFQKSFFILIFSIFIFVFYYLIIFLIQSKK